MHIVDLASGVGGSGGKSVHRAEYDRLRESIVTHRIASGLSQRAVSKLLGMPPTYVSKVESGERRIDVIEFIELAKAIKVDPRALFEHLLDA